MLIRSTYLMSLWISLRGSYSYLCKLLRRGGNFMVNSLGNTLGIGLTTIEKWLGKSILELQVNSIYRLRNPRTGHVYYIHKNPNGVLHLYDIDVVGYSFGGRPVFSGVEYLVDRKESVKTGDTWGSTSSSSAEVRWIFDNYAVN